MLLYTIENTLHIVIGTATTLDQAKKVCEEDGQVFYDIFDNVGLAASWTAKDGLVSYE